MTTTTPTLAVAIAIIETNDQLSLTKRRDLISSINRVASMIDRPPSQITTHPPDLRRLLQTIHPVTAGITAKTLANIKSNLARALCEAGLMESEVISEVETVEWKTFRTEQCKKNQGWALARLARFASDRNVSPDKLTEKTVREFVEYINLRQLGKDPETLGRSMMETYNAVIKQNGLDWRLLDYPRKPVYQARSISDYPISLQEDVAAYVARLSEDNDLFAEDGPANALKPTSIRNIKAHIRQFLDALVTSGFPIAAMENLSTVVTPENIKAAFRVVQKRLDEQKPQTLYNLSATLLAILRHHIKAEKAVVAEVLKFKKRLAPERKGMTPKNRARLAQFDDPHNLINLVTLPGTIRARSVDRPDSSRAAAVDMLYATGIQLLLSCPMRINNLSGLDIERDLHVTSNGSHKRYRIIVSSLNVKNVQAVEVALNARTSRLLHLYIHRFRPRLFSGQSTALFPTTDGKPRDPANFGKAVSDAVYREIGLKMNPHLFRHFGAKLFLNANPGEYESVRRLLGHKRIQTTMDFYAEISNEWALRKYDDILREWGGGTDDQD